MSVLKSIFHRYNKTTSSYDTLHPETEHGQITDFGQGVIAHLASNVLASTISSITSDSLMAKLVKLVFNATGVQYNIAQNGYVKFGDLFGGLIIQWGNATGFTDHIAITLPIVFTETNYKVIANELNGDLWSSTNIGLFGSYLRTTSSFWMRGLTYTSSGITAATVSCQWIAIGI